MDQQAVLARSIRDVGRDHRVQRLQLLQAAVNVAHRVHALARWEGRGGSNELGHIGGLCWRGRPARTRGLEPEDTKADVLEQQTMRILGVLTHLSAGGLDTPLAARPACLVRSGNEQRLRHR